MKTDKNPGQSQQRLLAAIPLFQWRDDLPRIEEVPIAKGPMVDHLDIVAFSRNTLSTYGTDPIYCGILLSLQLSLSKQYVEIVSCSNEVEGSDPFGYCSETIRDRAYDLFIRLYEERRKNAFCRDDWETLVRQLTRRLVYLSCEHPYIHYANRIVPMMTNRDLQILAKEFSITGHEESSFASVLEIQKHLIDLASKQTIYWAAILPNKTTPQQNFSCFPNAQLDWPNAELVKIYDDDDVPCTTMPVLESEDRDKAYQQRTGSSCHCIRCQYEVMGKKDIVSLPLARFYMAKGDFNVAKVLYEAALRHATQTSKLDIQHALGAIELAKGNFIGAQSIWQDAIVAGGEAAMTHKGLQLQREKLEAYAYLEQQPTISTWTNKFPIDNPFPGAFVAHVMDSAQCRRVIQWTESHSKWTAGRHHAVPTRDIPVHAISDLLQWFRNDLMDKVVHPLLIKCFGGTQFHVHDAFVVKYEASAISNYLSIHTDESTHSFVLALNDDFEGGGTYFHRYKKLIQLPTGSILVFRGDQLSHGGQPVTSGTRYILAAFLYQQLQKSGKSHSLVAEAIRDGKKQKTDFSFSFLAENGT